MCFCFCCCVDIYKYLFFSHLCRLDCPHRVTVYGSFNYCQFLSSFFSSSSEIFFFFYFSSSSSSANYFLGLFKLLLRCLFLVFWILGGFLRFVVSCQWFLGKVFKLEYLTSNWCLPSNVISRYRLLGLQESQLNFLICNSTIKWVSEWLLFFRFVFGDDNLL